MTRKKLDLLLAISLLISACASPSPAATATPSETPKPSGPLLSELFPSSTPTLAAITAQAITAQVTIDGDASDWASYPTNMTDPEGDQDEGHPDILEARFFKNDEYLYILIMVGEQGEWTKLGIHFATEGGGEGQLNIYQPFAAKIRGEAGSPLQDVPVLFAQGQAVEVKIALSKLPGPIDTIDALGFAITVGGADVYGDITDTSVLVLQTVDEPEGVTETRVSIDGIQDDWTQYESLVMGATNDVPAGAVDMVSVKAFNNDQYLYLAITQQDPDLVGKYAAVVRTDSDDEPDFYVGFTPGQSVAGFQPIGASSIANVAGVEVAQGEIVEVKIPLALFGGVPVLYVHLQTEFNGPVADGLDFVPMLTSELEPAGSLAGSGVTTSGLITKDETWSGEIHLTGDIFLATGVTLTIEPGTIVYVASNSDDQQSGTGQGMDDYITSHNDPVGTEEWDKNAIWIDGRNGILNFVGTEEEPIVFRPEGDSTSSGQWSGIFIERGTIKYTEIWHGGRNSILATGFIEGREQIEIAYNKVINPYWCGICALTNNLWIHHNIVGGGAHQAMAAGSGSIVEHNYVENCQNAIFVGGVDIVVRNNIAVDCARGLQIDWGARQIPAGSQITFSNNTIAWIDGPPKGWYYQGKLIYDSFTSGGAIGVFEPNLKVIIENNLIYGPYSWGIGFFDPLAAGSLVDYNLIWGTGAKYQGSFASAAGSHNLFADPLLTFSSDKLSYELGAGSPAIDAGAPGTTDADGSPADLGAFGGAFGADW